MKKMFSPKLNVSGWLALALSFLLAQTIQTNLRAGTLVSAGSTAGVPGFVCLFPIVLDTDTNIAGLQFDLVYNKDTVPQCQVQDAGSTAGLTLFSRQIAPGVLRVLAYAPENSPLNKGILVQGQLAISENALAGVNSIVVSNLVVTGIDGSRIADATAGDGNFAIFNSGMFHGIEDLAWILGGDPSAAQVAITVAGSNTNYLAFRGPPAGAKPAWDTLNAADGKYQISAVFQNKSGQTTREFVRDVVVNNAVAYHSGWITNAQTWSNATIHVVESSVIVASNTTLTVEPGAIVKFARGATILLYKGASLNALGESGRHIVFTSLADDEGGDTNFDESNSTPNPGDWPGLQLTLGSKLEVNENVEFRFVVTTHQGVIARNEVWDATHLHRVLDDLTVNAPATLTILPGATVKFEPGKKINVMNGGQIVASGTAAQPITFTSIKDDSVGGDTNLDGNKTTPSAGDWGWVFLNGGNGFFAHCQLSYGGGPAEGGWGPSADSQRAKATLKTVGGASLSISNSVIRESFYDGVLAWGGEVTISGCVLSGIDRAVSAHPGSPVLVVNSTLFNNRIGLLAHGGTLRARNNIVAYSIASGIQYDFGTIAEVSYCNVWSPLSWASANYLSYGDQTGKNGNISKDPRFKDADRSNFRLNFGSPCIDAADGTAAPPTDFIGIPRATNPHSMLTGAPDAKGVYADMGAYEFSENSPSDMDLVVLSVSGPSSVVAGDIVHVEWVVSNRGTTRVDGPWHDMIYLLDSTSNARIQAAEVLVGQGARLGPGQFYTASADIKAPGGLVKSYRWEVQANSQGEIFEGQNRNNNFTASVGDVALDLQELEVNGSAIPGKFNSPEDGHLFKFIPAAGEDVMVVLNIPNGAGVSELYIAKGYAPTVQSFDFRQREWNSASVSTLASGADSNSVYYVLAFPRSLTGSPVNFTIRAAEVDFSIDKTVPTQVGNAGEATLEIFGANLRRGTLFSLLSTNGFKSAAWRTTHAGSGKVYATFPLTHFPPGPASIVAEQDGVTATGTNLIQVVSGGAGSFYAYFTGPKVVRLGRAATWYLTYGNKGLIDVPVPLLRVAIPNSKEIRLFDSTLNWADSFVLLGINDKSLLPTLGPGQETTLAVIATPGLGSSVSVQVEIMPGDVARNNPTPLPWSEITAPAGVAAALWQNERDLWAQRLGKTVGDYYTVLMNDLSELASDYLGHDYVANVNGLWQFGKEPVGVSTPNPILEIADNEIPVQTAASRLRPLSLKPGDGIHKTWYVIVTSEDYRRRGSGNLPGTAKDSADLRQYLNQDMKTPKEQAIILHDSASQTNDDLDATKVTDAIKSLKGKVDSDDKVVIIFSGHGGRDAAGNGYLAVNSRTNGVISAQNMENAIVDVGAGETYLVTDACHSEAFVNDVWPFSWQTKYTGIAATRKDRVSWDTASGGELILAIKKNLRDCNSMQDSFDKAQKSISAKYAGETNQEDRQDPYMKNRGNNDLSGKPWQESMNWWAACKKGFWSAAGYGEPQKELVPLVGSIDPNDKVGPAGSGLANFIGVRQVLPYTIYFENKSAAQAPAQEVLVIDQLDANLDWSTLELKTIAFNDVKISVPPGLQQYTSTASVATDTNTVSVRVSFDTQTGVLQWLLQSQDPSTGMLPEDPYAGFLPPNDATHRGEGSLSYVIKARASSTTGSQIANQARIIFDPTYGLNQPIDTPVVVNTVDAAPPTSAVGELPADSYRQFVVNWSGQDDPGGSGILGYDLFVSKDGSSFIPWLTGATGTQAVFDGEVGAMYRFYSLAHDSAGNLQTTPVSPFATTRVTLAAPVLSASITSNTFMLMIADIVPGRSYGIEQSATMAEGSWQNVKSFTADANAARYAIDVPAGANALFFRVRVE